MATHSSILAWRIPWTEESAGLQSMGLQKCQSWLTRLSTYHALHTKLWDIQGKIKGTRCCSSFRLVSSVAQVVSDSLWPHEPQHIRPPCPSPTPRVYLNSCPLSPWCHPTISSSTVPFSSCPQSFPASGSFPMSQLFTGGGQSIEVSASASVLPINTQDWFPLGWTGWVSLLSKGLSRVFSNTTVQKHQFFCTQLSLQSNSHIHTWLLEKPQPWLDRPLSGGVLGIQQKTRIPDPNFTGDYWEGFSSLGFSLASDWRPRGYLEFGT